MCIQPYGPEYWLAFPNISYALIFYIYPSPHWCNLAFPRPCIKTPGTSTSGMVFLCFHINLIWYGYYALINRNNDDWHCEFFSSSIVGLFMLLFPTFFYLILRHCIYQCPYILWLQHILYTLINILGVVFLVSQLIGAMRKVRPPYRGQLTYQSQWLQRR